MIICNSTFSTLLIFSTLSTSSQHHLHRKSSTYCKSSCSLLSRGIHVLKHNLLMGDSLSPGMLINMLLSFAAIIVIIARLWLLKIYMSYVHFHIQKLKKHSANLIKFPFRKSFGFFEFPFNGKLCLSRSEFFPFLIKIVFSLNHPKPP